MVAPLLPRAPIDEVVIGFVLDRPLGPDAVEAGRYMAERRERFVRHEIHEPIMLQPSWLEFPGPTRVWFISADDAWLVQLQHDRFHTNWRRRGDAPYPGFTRQGGAMHFALSEFALFQDFCTRTRGGQTPNALNIEVAKIDLLIQGRHWQDTEDAAGLIPIIASALRMMETPGPNLTVQTQESIGDVILTISLTPARLKAEPSVYTFQLQFRATQPAGEDLHAQLVGLNEVLNRAFERVVPDYRGRFS